MSEKEKQYPKKITDGRESLEASFVFCLWKQPDLFDDFKNIDGEKNQTLITKDGQFYYNLGKSLYHQGLKSFDNVSIYNYLENKPTVKKHFDEKGGYSSVDELMGIVNPDNSEMYFDKLVKLNTLMTLYDKGFNIEQNLDKFLKMTSQEIYDYYDFQLNKISIDTGHEIEIKDLVIDDEFIDECNNGTEMGISYGKICKILNYLTLGLPLGELYMLAGHSGVGKSSFVFENMILSCTENDVKCAVISNEQRINAFKSLLLIHILTQDLNYWDLTRKKIKIGNFTAEQKKMLKKAQEISEKKYSNIRFVKLFDNNVDKVKKIIRKLSKLGYQLVMFDTMKADDNTSDNMWQQLLMQSRQLFQLASKENIALVTTFQLALSTKNKRYLDESCLANSKQVKEVYSEMVYIRPLWDDEYTGEKFDCKAYRREKDESGKWTKIQKPIELDKDKKYIVAFLNKTRNDEDNQTVLYEFIGRYNKWVEKGYCYIQNNHM